MDLLNWFTDDFPFSDEFWNQLIGDCTNISYTDAYPISPLLDEHEAPATLVDEPASSLTPESEPAESGSKAPPEPEKPFKCAEPECARLAWARPEHLQRHKSMYL